MKVGDKVVYIKDNPLTFGKVYDLIGCSPSCKYCVIGDQGYCIWEDWNSFITFKEYENTIRKRKLRKLDLI